MRVEKVEGLYVSFREIIIYGLVIFSVGSILNHSLLKLGRHGISRKRRNCQSLNPKTRYDIQCQNLASH